MKMLCIPFLILFSLIGSFADAQVPKYRVLSFPVDKGGKSLKMPWVGGVNSPQFSEIDLNEDSYPDLFIFDRVGDKILTYINNGTNSDTAYQYAPQYESMFPSDLNAWAIIRDYNFDGIPDIFAHTNTGIKVYKGERNNGILSFNVTNPLLTYFDGTYHVNIWTNIDDIPVVTDVNRDGDLDILTFGIFGSAVEYYENQSVEQAGNPAYAFDSLQFTLSTLCWGNFTENSLTNGINLNISCKTDGQASVDDGARHVGSTLFDFDADNDHDVDLLIGDISFNTLVFVQNCGDSAFAFACASDSTFPSCNVPVNIPVFPAAYSIDADNDGDKDLIAAPNARVAAQDVDNVWLYKNSGSSCGWEFNSDSFLVYHSLDFGTDSKPYFFDFNYDGLMDIVVGNYGYFRQFQSYKSALAFLENTGTLTSPKFTLLTDDYNNFSSLNLVGMHPGFGDLNGDNLPDMLVGENTGVLHFFKNTGSGSANFASLTSPQYFGLDIGQNSAPFIYDMNGDSLNDIVVGRKDGKLTYFWNFGTKTFPEFSPDSANTFFGEINVTVPGYTEGYSAPFISKTANGALELYVGSNRGLTFKYLVDINHLRSGSFALIDSNFIGYDIGSESTISIADINSDGKMEYLLGNSGGGLILFSDTLLDTSVVLNLNQPDEAKSLRLYPNPTKDLLTITSTGIILQQPILQIIDLNGQTVFAQQFADAKQITVNTAALSAGMYLLRIQSGEEMLYSKFLKTY